MEIKQESSVGVSMPSATILQPTLSEKVRKVSMRARFTGLASMPRTRDMSSLMKSGRISAMDHKPE